ncbi:multidrug effflux MFS transporter [Wenxinia marina]|uniref:Arabinose efflux permease n=1 Tax=Wenxinia marina DSM 24838 TaxID=1123501 RepID=A0A0D0P8L6_9RHOB|nr:multidrug effflux MFS transporter [Wenxinia marina]KIQ67911.1 Arabinose efflux permease [Wenxinia marina DSM 24838]GGL74170.1 MFS transporter [Wenxinia marina]
MRAPTRQLSRPEFVGLCAFLFATVAFSVDAMLPALPEIAEVLSPGDPNQAQLVLTAFVFGMGLGTFVSGPLSDAFGRKAVITAGLALYMCAAAAAALANSLEWLLAARVLQGIGAAAPRIAVLAMVRDLYAGRRMAQLMSFVMMVFIIVPAMAPFVGSLIIDGFGWRGVFVAFVLFGLTGATWMNLRQPETLPRESRRPLRAGTLWMALKEVASNRLVVLYTTVLTVGFAQMFALLSSIQQIYDGAYGKAESFPAWFLLGGLISGVGTIGNASLVMRLGMRRIAVTAYAAQTLLTGVLILGEVTGVLSAVPPFWLFFAWSVSLFAMAGLTFGNLNALALEPTGHIAGLASSAVGAVSTVLAVAIAAPIGLMFDGTPLPLMWGVFVCSTIALGLMMWSRRLDPETRTPETVQAEAAE